MNNTNALIVDNFDSTLMFFQIFNVVMVISFIVIAFITIRKLWMFLDKAIEYLDNKNDGFNKK